MTIFFEYPIVGIYHGYVEAQDKLAISRLRGAFVQWYVQNTHDLERNPIGSRDCDLQWRAWLAASKEGEK